MNRFTVLLCAIVISFCAVAADAAPAKKSKSTNSFGEFFSDINWSKPMVELTGGYIFVPGSSFSGFLNDAEDYSKTTGYDRGFDSRNGGLTVNLDVLWDMNLAKKSKETTAPGKLYAGMGIGFLQVASASWRGDDPRLNSTYYPGDYSASYFIVPIEFKAKYYMFTKGFFVSGGFGLGIESITYSFEYDYYDDSDITDSDDAWYYQPKETGTGAGFICNVGAGYDYELRKDVFITGSMDVYFYYGKTWLICPNPKIGVIYKF